MIMWLSTRDRDRQRRRCAVSRSWQSRGLVEKYGVWSDWTLWQYAGVDWERGRSRPKVYSHGSYRFPLYFGNVDRPLERNVFNGSRASLQTFWERHGLKLK